MEARKFGKFSCWQTLFAKGSVERNVTRKETNSMQKHETLEKKRFLVQLYISTCPHARLGCLLLTHQPVYESKYYKWAWKGLTYFTACLPSEFRLLCVRLLYHQTVLPVIFYIDGKIFNKLAHAFKKKIKKSKLSRKVNSSFHTRYLFLKYAEM